MQDVRVNHFVSAITKEAEAQRNQILQEQETKIAAAVAQAETAARQNYELALARAASTIRLDIGSQVSAGKVERRQALLLRREAMTDEIMEAVRQKLEAFTASSDYQVFLERSAADGAARMPGSTFYLRPADQHLAQAVSAAAGGVAVETDPSILLGGLKWQSPDGVRRADDTLDSRLAAGRSWFASHSDLIIT